MDGSIQVNYTDVTSKTSEIRNRIATELASMEDSYHHIQSMLDDADSATNATLKATMEANREKSIIAAMTLDKLLSFMSNSSTQVEMTEQQIKHQIESNSLIIEVEVR